VAYGDAQVSVPPTWVVMTHAWCGGTWPPVVQLGVVKQDMDCPAAPTPLRFGSPRSVRSASYRQEQPVRLNGISVLLGPKVATSVTYFVPSLHVVLLGSCGSLDPEIVDTPCHDWALKFKAARGDLSQSSVICHRPTPPHSPAHQGLRELVFDGTVTGSGSAPGGHVGVTRTGLARSVGGSYANRSCEVDSVRATTAFNKMIAPLGAQVAGVEFQDDVLVLFVRASRRRLYCSCGFSTASPTTARPGAGGTSTRSGPR